jgi:peroxiredoxin
MKVEQLLAALEKKFQDVRDAEIPLGARLKCMADEVRRMSPAFAEAVDTFVGRLERVEAGSGAPRVGEPMPPFVLPDEQGQIVSLEKLLETAPVAIAVVRGHWCAYCRLNAVGLAEVQDRIAPAHLVAISPEARKYLRVIKREAKASFPFLSDIDNGYALSLNLAIWVDDAMSSLIAAAGWDVPSYQAGEAWILPVPSAFVVDQGGIVRFRHVDPDYRRRVEPGVLVNAVLEVMRGAKASGSLQTNRRRATD